MLASSFSSFGPTLSYKMKYSFAPSFAFDSQEV
jgi:hypothetical protein